MVKLPFHGALEDLFASDRSVLLKILGGAFVGGVLGLRLISQEQRAGRAAYSQTVKVAIIAGGAVVGAVLVLLLLLRDVVVRRVREGKPVNLFLRAYFGQGNGCLMVVLWFFTVIFVTLVVTMLTTNL